MRCGKGGEKGCEGRGGGAMRVVDGLTRKERQIPSGKREMLFGLRGQNKIFFSLGTLLSHLSLVRSGCSSSSYFDAFLRSTEVGPGVTQRSVRSVCETNERPSVHECGCTGVERQRERDTVMINPLTKVRYFLSFFPSCWHSSYLVSVTVIFKENESLHK